MMRQRLESPRNSNYCFYYVNYYVQCYLLLLLLFHWSPIAVVVGQWSTTRHCPQQCSCTLQRTYVSMTGDYDELEILCNRYAARFGANLSAIPNMTALKSNRDYWVQVTMEQLEFEILSGQIFGQHKIKSLKIMNNLKLKSINAQTITSVRETLEELVVLGNQALETFPYESLAVLSNLKLLSLQFVKNHTRWKSPVFPHVASLETVNLMGAGFGRYLKGLGHLKNLKQLSLGEMNVGSRKYADKRFQFLLKLKNLTSLALEKVNLSVVPVQLGKMNQLKHLFLKSNKLTINKQWPDTSDLPDNIEILDLRWNNYESFPCKVFGLAHLNNLKTDSEVLCFSCESDKKRIEQQKAACTTGPNDLKRRKSPDAINAENSITEDMAANNDEDSSGWYEETSEESEEANSQPVDSIQTYPTVTSATQKLFLTSATTRRPTTVTVRPVLTSPRIRPSPKSVLVTRISSLSPKQPLTGNGKPFSVSTPSYSFKVVTRSTVATLPSTKILLPKNSSSNSLRTDYFYEDDPDWQSEHLISPKSNDV